MHESRRAIAIGAAVAAAWVTAFRLAVAAEPAAAPPMADAEALPDATATDRMPAVVKDVQRALGGPLADQFPWLSPRSEVMSWWKQFGGQPAGSFTPDAATPDAAPEPVADSTASDAATITGTPGRISESWWRVRPPRLVVQAIAESAAPPATTPLAALRAAAIELDASANRLEDLALYDQADAMRSLAQRLRRDARQLRGGGSIQAASPAAPTEAAGKLSRPHPGAAPLPMAAPAAWEPPADSERRQGRRLRARRGEAVDAAGSGSDNGADYAAPSGERSVLIEPRTE
jgi:hypothetical protein